MPNIMNKSDSLPRLNLPAADCDKPGSSSDSGGAGGSGHVSRKGLDLPLNKVGVASASGVHRSSSSSALPPLTHGSPASPMEAELCIQEQSSMCLLAPTGPIHTRCTSCPSIDKSSDCGRSTSCGLLLTSPTGSISPHPPDTPRTSLKSFNVSACDFDGDEDADDDDSEAGGAKAFQGGGDGGDGDDNEEDPTKYLNIGDLPRPKVGGSSARAKQAACRQDSYGKCLLWLQHLPPNADVPPEHAQLTD